MNEFYFIIMIKVQKSMSKNTFQNLHSLQAISAIGMGELDLSMCQNQSHPTDKYTIKINKPQGQLTPQYFSPSQKSLEPQSKKITTKNTYSTDNTGYDINRQLFSDDDIRQAFNTIDINCDGQITAGELSFFLKCMNQSHTPREVEEMIRMVSNDGKKVVIEDFKKIGRGKLPPFAAIRQPQTSSIYKQEAIQHIRQSQLSSLGTVDLLQMKDQLQLSHQRYQQQKGRKQEPSETLVQPLIQQNGGMRQRTSDQIKEKKWQYSQVLMLNVQNAIKVLKSFDSEVVQIFQLSEMFTISESQARILFDNRSRLTVRQVIMEVILFSQGSNLKKLELILGNRGYGQRLQLDQWIVVLCFMMGVDQKTFIKKRLQSILKHRKIQLNAKYDRYFILQLMTQEYSLFLW